jgi:hypothetical protein
LDFFIDVLDIKTYDDEKWDKLITQIQTKIATPVIETHNLKSRNNRGFGSRITDSKCF